MNMYLKEYYISKIEIIWIQLVLYACNCAIYDTKTKLFLAILFLKKMCL